MGMISRNGPFIAIGFVRFTKCAVIDEACRHSDTSTSPGPFTSSG